MICAPIRFKSFAKKKSFAIMSFRTSRNMTLSPEISGFHTPLWVARRRRGMKRTRRDQPTSARLSAQITG
jgi:hypothetical protein